MEWLPTPVFWPGEFHGLYSHRVAKSQTLLSNFHLSLCPWCLLLLSSFTTLLKSSLFPNAFLLKTNSFIIFSATALPNFILCDPVSPILILLLNLLKMFLYQDLNTGFFLCPEHFFLTKISYVLL